MSEWISPWDKMPNIGDHIYVTDGKEVHQIIVACLPENPWESNVTGWKYVKDEN